MADFPSGIILLWHGSIASIPVGWTLCDGTAGTPDLRDRFVNGAGNTYVVDQRGGANNHSHTFTSNVHHHTIPAGTDIASGANHRNQSSDDTASGTVNIASQIPPYHALAFIMKL